jgi:hypothetical protein
MMSGVDHRLVLDCLTFTQLVDVPWLPALICCSASGDGHCLACDCLSLGGDCYPTACADCCRLSGTDHRPGFGFLL